MGSSLSDGGVGAPDGLLPGVLTHPSRCFTSLLLSPASRPGYFATSATQCLYPALNLSGDTVPSDRSPSKCFTVISNMSAFSNLECLAGCNKIEIFLTFNIQLDHIIEENNWPITTLKNLISDQRLD